MTGFKLRRVSGDYSAQLGACYSRKLHCVWLSFTWTGLDRKQGVRLRRQWQLASFTEGPNLEATPICHMNVLPRPCLSNTAHPEAEHLCEGNVKLRRWLQEQNQQKQKGWPPKQTGQNEYEQKRRQIESSNIKVRISFLYMSEVKVKVHVSSHFSRVTLAADGNRLWCESWCWPGHRWLPAALIHVILPIAVPDVMQFKATENVFLKNPLSCMCCQSHHSVFVSF